MKWHHETALPIHYFRAFLSRPLEETPFEFVDMPEALDEMASELQGEPHVANLKECLHPTHHVPDQATGRDALCICGYA